MGSEREMACGSRISLNIPTNSKGGNFDIYTEAASKDPDSTSWESSFALATKLFELDIDTGVFNADDLSQRGQTPPPWSIWSKPQVLQLGDGGGLLGVVAAILWKTNVICTELDGCKPGIATNISLNKTLLHRRGGLALIGDLNWKEPQHLIMRDPTFGEKVLHRAKDSKVAVVLAVDCIHSKEDPELLAKTILAWLSCCSQARVVISHRCRKELAGLMQDLWQRLEGIGLMRTQDGQNKGSGEQIVYEWSIWRWSVLLQKTF